jgi:hypothetical protein
MNTRAQQAAAPCTRLALCQCRRRTGLRLASALSGKLFRGALILMTSPTRNWSWMKREPPLLAASHLMPTVKAEGSGLAITSEYCRMRPFGRCRSINARRAHRPAVPGHRAAELEQIGVASSIADRGQADADELLGCWCRCFFVPACDHDAHMPTHRRQDGGHRPLPARSSPHPRRRLRR